MKILKLAIGIALTSTIMWSCKNETEPQVKTVETAEVVTKKEIADDVKLAKAEFNIEGMTCAIGCAKTIEKKLSEMEGVKSATVDFDNKLAMVEYDEALVNPTSLEKTVTTASDKYAVINMKSVESFSTDGAKKGCDRDCKKACCAGKDKKECNHEGKECKKGMKDCKMSDKASCKGMDKKKCAGKDKASCKGKSKKECKMKEGDKASMGENHGEKMAHGKDCKMACCADKKA
ncbi:MAG: cation transporter [Flavobacteriaceae bacterium]|nr:cation transporter [Flavobacteriaceae bacterium]